MYSGKSWLHGLVLVGVGLVLLWQAVVALHLNHRLAVNPHARATIERTWVTSGKHATRYADVSFPGPVGIGLCHATGVRLGSSAVVAHDGQAIDIVPTPGSCSDPDAPTAGQAGLAIAIEIAFAFVIFLIGVGMWLGLVPAFSRPRRFAGFYR